MTGKEALLEMLREERAKKEQSQDIDWATKREQWLQSLQELMQQIREWLSAAEDEGLLSVEDSTFPVTEDYIGEYDAPGLVISSPVGRQVDVRPYALLVIGARGRVHMESGPKREMLLRNDEGEWLLASREAGGIINTLPLTEETFSETLRAILS